jgi:hypothetical protein
LLKKSMEKLTTMDRHESPPGKAGLINLCGP